MRRRVLMMGLPLLAAGCSALEKPYVERRQWPLEVRRGNALPVRAGGRILELRSMRAAPGMEARGLRTMQDDGSVRVAFYEEWLVPPADAIEDSLRRWLGESGLFAAVTAPGSRIEPDYIMEAELGGLWAAPSRRMAQAVISAAVLGQRPELPKVALQRRFETSAAMEGEGPPAEVAAQVAALTVAFALLEAALRGAVR